MLTSQLIKSVFLAWIHTIWVPWNYSSRLVVPKRANPNQLKNNPGTQLHPAVSRNQPWEPLGFSPADQQVSKRYGVPCSPQLATLGSSPTHQHANNSFRTLWTLQPPMLGIGFTHQWPVASTQDRAWQPGASHMDTNGHQFCDPSPTHQLANTSYRTPDPMTRDSRTWLHPPVGQYYLLGLASPTSG